MEETQVSALPVFDFADKPTYEAFALAANTGRRQPMAGFDADYTDIVDYIVRCTHKIWEEKAVGLIYTHYTHNATVHTSSGTIYGRETVVRNTVQNLAMWGDLRAYADDVIWSGNERDGFYTSHRHANIATQSGYTEFGPATGRKISYWGIADCLIVENKIAEEWLTHDGVTVIRQMGYDPVALAKQAVLPSSPHTTGELDRLPTGQQAPVFLRVPPPNDDPQAFVAAVLQNLWNARLINMVREHYAPGHLAFLPDSRKTYGHGDYENFVITLLAAFPDLTLTLQHQCVLGSAERGFRVATRFILQGTHEGYGPYGAPTGRRVFLIGMSHHVIKGGKIVQEWTVFDEFALLKQLYGQIGGVVPSEAGEESAFGTDGRDISEYVAQANTGREQRLEGFDPEYTDIVDYIIRCTHKIWEDKAIGLIYTHYAHNTPVHLTDAEYYGRDQMVENTVRTLAAFPDLRLFGDEVIWSGNDVDGFHTSHRVTWSGHHLGHSVYGPPTGQRIQRREIAHCIVRKGRIVEEWSVQDETALIRQLGLDEVQLATVLAQAEAASGGQPYAGGAGEVPRLNGQLHPPVQLDGDPRDPDALPGLLYSLVWNARMLNYLAEYYAPGAVVWVPGNRRLEGLGDLTHYILQLLAAFPDGAMHLEHVTWVGSEAQGYQVAARWTFQGTHHGPSGYGAPTGKRVRVLGISHFEVEGGQIVREYMVWNEFALLKQLHWPE